MTDTSEKFSALNQKKADMQDVYDQADPRAYFNKIQKLDYVIPARAKPVFMKIIHALRNRNGIDRLTIADLGCSYGVNAALLKYGLELDELYARYRADDMREASVAETVCRDLDYFRRRERGADLRIVGIDMAHEAVGYANAVGLLDDGIAANFESEEPSDEAAQLLSGIDLIISTGCVGYVTERSFEHILDTVQGPPPWVASFVLRIFPYDGIARALARRGLVTERFGDPFPQRRFATAEERRAALDALRRLGRDPTGLEAEGQYFAEFFLSRPKAEVDALPLRKIIGD